MLLYLWRYFYSGFLGPLLIVSFKYWILRVFKRVSVMKYLFPILLCALGVYSFYKRYLKSKALYETNTNGNKEIQLKFKKNGDIGGALFFLFGVIVLSYEGIKELLLNL